MAGLETTPESVDYAASILDPPPGLSSGALLCRLSAFGELLELLVLADILHVEASLSEKAPLFLVGTGFQDAITLFHGPERDETEWFGSWRAATQLLRYSEDSSAFDLAGVTDAELHSALDAWFLDAVSLISQDSIAVRDFTDFLVPYAVEDHEEAEEYRRLLRIPGSIHLLEGKESSQRTIALGIFLRGVIESALVVNADVPAALVPIGVERELLAHMPVFSPASIALVHRLSDQKQRNLTRMLDTMHARYSRRTIWPALFASMVSEASTLAELYDVALGWRVSKEVKRYRQWCNELDDAMAQGLESDVIRLVAASEEFIQSIVGRSKGTFLQTIQLQVSFPPSITLSPGGLFTSGRHRKLLLLKKIAKQTLAPNALNSKFADIFGIKV